jgi:ribose transport system substrate-binding protein
VLAAIKAGQINGGTIAQNPFGQGYIACELASLLVQGYAPRKDIYFINSGTVYVTKANADNYGADLQAVTKKILATLKEKYVAK